ncbi:MAG: hypothetical protein IJH37_05140 [Clostridia bacterium]|nr:hypothetical protein [Clostridia bacterium]
MHEHELTDEDIAITITALENTCYIIDDFLRSGQKDGKRQAMNNRELATETIESLKTRSEKVSIQSVEIAITSLRVLKDQINELYNLPDSTEAVKSKSKEMRRSVNHAIRTYKAICINAGIDPEAFESYM